MFRFGVSQHLFQVTVREGFRTKEIIVLLQVQTEGFDRNVVDEETGRLVENLLSSSQNRGLIIHGILLQVVVLLDLYIFCV